MQSGANPANTSLLQRWGPWTWPALPLACHLGFSWIGFNPTDDGWLPAVARRLLEGEIPHRDFISLIPVLSAALQVPLVLWGGDHVFWLARLWGWLEIGGISWWWSGLLLPDKLAAWLRPALYAVIFLLNAHVFDVMAWHSLDGLLFATAALVLARRGTTAAWRAAFACAGLAAMCRQNFALFIPFLVLGLPGWRKWSTVFWCGLPPAIYLLVMFVTGALPDFWEQILASHDQLYRVAVACYGESPAFLGGLGLGILGAFGLHLVRRQGPRWSFCCTQLLLLGTGLFMVFTLWPGKTATSSFALFGFACALLGATLPDRNITRATRFPVAAALGLAWVVAVSIGYNNPALMSGVMLVATWRLAELIGACPVLSTATGLATVGVTLAGLVVSFQHARLNYPYEDKPAAELSWDAGAVMRGAAGLRTNLLTYAVLDDLRRITDRFEARNQPYAILTDYSAAWVRSRQRNPLACEWPQITSLGADFRLTTRLVRQMCSLPPGVQIIVQKDVIAWVKGGLFPVAAARDYYFVQTWLQRHGQKVGETAYFTLYLPPRGRVKYPVPPND